MKYLESFSEGKMNFFFIFLRYSMICLSLKSLEEKNLENLSNFFYFNRKKFVIFLFPMTCSCLIYNSHINALNFNAVLQNERSPSGIPEGLLSIYASCILTMLPAAFHRRLLSYLSAFLLFFSASTQTKSPTPVVANNARY